MKRVVLYILMVCISCSFCACSSSSMNAEVTEKPAALNVQLSGATTHLKAAEEEMVSISADIVNTWLESSNLVELYYTKETFDRDHNYEKMITSKEKVDGDLQKAKSIIQLGGSSDYYQAVKEYYLAVKALYDLVYNYPVGYSLYTYSEAKQRLQSDCTKAYAEVEFCS